jgi:threonine dehydrogenase-like Zn-dependent dehydrogenase
VTPRSVVISQVAMGTLTASTCSRCGTHETSFEVVALLPTGTLVIGDISVCNVCGDLWHCRFCPQIFSADGVKAHRHMLAEHSI